MTPEIRRSAKAAAAGPSACPAKARSACSAPTNRPTSSFRSASGRTGRPRCGTSNASAPPSTSARLLAVAAAGAPGASRRIHVSVP